MSFKDHFSSHAESYARFRPTYPQALYEALYACVSNFDLAWDCGTGNGQVALQLANRFKKVIASDASAQQIEHATRHPKVSYHVCKAEQSGFDDRSFDLITVGQAIHWFDFEPFFDELRRVIRPGGIFSCWTYRFLTIDPDLDKVLQKFFDLIESYWPPERDHVEALYATIPFPPDFIELEIEPIHIDRAIAAHDVLNYLRTWSSVKNYRNQHGSDPVNTIEAEFLSTWDDPATPRPVRHPMLTKVYKLG